MRPPLPTHEKIDLVWRLPLIFVPQLALNLIRCGLLSWWRGLPIRFYLLASIVRTFLGSFSALQIQFLSPAPLEAYKSWISKRTAIARKSNDSLTLSRLKVDIETLPDGRSSLLWVGDRTKASKYVLFFPGGGYVVPLTSGHLEWCFQSYVQTQDSDPEVAVAVLQYTLCPAAKHPTQLYQASAALLHMINSGIRASDIVVGGDSAGGNLTAQLLCRLARPSNPLNLNEPLAGAFMVSPWVSSLLTTRSFVDNEYIDMLSLVHAQNANRVFLAAIADAKGTAVEELEWAMPLDADGKFLAGWEKAANSLHVMVGANEVFRDQGIQFAERVRTRNKKLAVHLEVMETDAHDFLLLEGMVASAAARITQTRTPRLTHHQSVVMSFFKAEHNANGFRH